MVDYKGAASWVEVKDSSVMATYPLVQQATVMDAGFGRRSRRETGRSCRSHVGRPAAICD
jgi:hypothetical protein